MAATIAGLAEHLPQAGADVEIWHLSRKVATPTKRAILGVEILDLPRYGVDKAALFVLPKATEAALRERARGVDVIHLHSVYQAENIAISRLRLGKPIVITPNGGYSEAVSHGRRRLSKLAWRRLWEDKLVRQSAALHAVSPPEVERLSRLYPRSVVHLIPNAVTLDTVLPVTRVCADGPFIFIGRVAVDHKGLDTLVHAYFEALRLEPGLQNLIIAGPDFRGGISVLDAQIRRLGLADRVTLVGPVFGPDKDLLMSTARCFIHTSRWEGFPFAVIEAMAKGLPVLVTPGTNVSKVVDDQGAGLVVQATVDSVAAGLVEMGRLGQQELHAMGDASLRTVRQMYTWEQVTPAMITLYREVCA